ncbi:MAG: hypothetical protein JWQ09_202 [Segetibacter sp.]|nr:hypothetical protein [Segetibacter sp.]
MAKIAEAGVPKYKWLVFFFVHEIMQYTHETEKLMKEISNSIIVREKGIKVVVLFDSVSKGSDGKYLFEYACREFYKRADVLPDYRNPLPSSIDLSKRNAWKEVFQFVFNNFPAEKRILLTWSHGNGFGIGYDGNAADQGPINDFSVTSNDVYFVDKECICPAAIPNVLVGDKFIEQEDFFAFPKKTYPPCVKLNLLWMQSLANTLKLSLPANEKIDLLMMVNCNMQLIDNAVILSDTVKYLVGAESVFAACGYNYVRLLSVLQRHSDINNRALCKTIVKDYVDKYLFEIPQGRELIKDNSLFANKLSHANLFLSLVNKLALALIKLIKDPAIKAIINTIRTTKLNDTSTLGTGFVDLGLFIKLLAKDIPLPNELKIYHGYYKTLLQKTVKAKHIGDNYLLEDEYRKRRYGLSGFSIYFPLNKSAFDDDRTVICAYYDVTTLGRFAIRSKWDEFLSQYFAT